MDNDTEFTLVPAPDETPFGKPHHRHAKRLILRQVAAQTAERHSSTLKINNSNLIVGSMVGSDVTNAISLLSLAAKTGLPPLAAALGTWLATRAGRKVKIKVDDVEIEASNAKEVQELLDQAQAFKQANEPKRIHER